MVEGRHSVPKQSEERDENNNDHDGNDNVFAIGLERALLRADVLMLAIVVAF
jgi:hypothetical protein